MDGTNANENSRGLLSTSLRDLHRAGSRSITRRRDVRQVSVRRLLFSDAIPSAVDGPTREFVLGKFPEDGFSRWVVDRTASNKEKCSSRLETWWHFLSMFSGHSVISNL